MKFAIVEQMGHRRFAGVVEEVTVAGAPMLRVTVPTWERVYTEKQYAYPEDADLYDGLSGSVERDAHESHAAFVVDLGAASLFAITWCDQARVSEVLAKESTESGPVTRTYSPWRPKRAQLPAPPEADAAPVPARDDDSEEIVF